MQISQSGVYVVTDKTDKRIIGWLWTYLMIHFRDSDSFVNNNVDLGFYGGPDIINKINNALSYIPRQEIEIQKASCILDITLYSWITDNREQIDWLINELIEICSFPLQNFKTVETDRNFIISLLDAYHHEVASYNDYYWAGNYNNRARQIRIDLNSNLHKKWWITAGSHKVLDWINDSKEPERLKAGWQVLRKQHSQLLVDYVGPEDFQEMINLFNKGNVEIPYRELFLDKVKRKHSQNKSREKTKNKKVQCNILITPKSMERLNYLKDKYEMSQASVIEILLLKEFENKKYITEKLRQDKADNLPADNNVINETVIKSV